jgi:indole-3-glycerol phosphate synthase
MENSNAVSIVAEVKTESPFGYKSKLEWNELFNIANTIGDIIAIHTDKRWGGSFDLIRKAKNLTDKPILAKGFHPSDSDIDRSLQAGADYVLVVGRVPPRYRKVYRQKCWIEPLGLWQLSEIPADMKAVWNSRDLNTGKRKEETFEQARIDWKGWLCQASFIRRKTDIKLGADAILVGEHLHEFAVDVEMKIQ